MNATGTVLEAKRAFGERAAAHVIGMLARFFSLLGLLTLGVARTVVAAAAWWICAQCGHEMPESASFCSHCGGQSTLSAGMGVVVPTVGGTEESEEEVAYNTQVRDALRDDVVRAHAQVEAGRPDLAVGFYRNARALATLLPADADSAQRAERLLEWERLCVQALRRVERRCVVCDGTGRGKLRVQTLAGEVSSQDAGPGTCRNCAGRGSVTGVRAPSDLMAVLAQGTRDADRLQEGAGRRAVGRAWVPALVLDKLNPREQVRLRRAAADPCTECGGLSITDCARCRGVGAVPCNNPECRDGWVVQQPAAGLLRDPLVTHRRCPVCEGRLQVSCDACRGSGGVACRRCRGSGQRAACTSCGGEGLATCRGCRGSGKIADGDCLRCGGEGVTLCLTCHGDGRARR